MWLDIENMVTIAYSVQKGDATVYMADEFISHIEKIAPANLKN
jgi:hypothetical protein